MATAKNDALALADVLKRKYRFKNTILLLDATRADILKALTYLRKRLTNVDNLLIYYAGHGWHDEDADEGYWLPVDADRDNPTNWVSNASITAVIRATKAKHIMVIADSCYSGKLSRSISVVGPITGVDLRRLAKKRSCTVLSSGGLEPVMDRGGGEHSVFAKTFLQMLEENEDILEGHRLFTLLRRPVMLNSDQTPEYSDIRKAGHDGGDFLFIRRK
ncbi:MAG: caspase family protein [Desulfobacterales bacterium]